MVSRSEYSGKRGANAGDEYHELWAVRRALELIVPSTRLCALTVEGVLAIDEQGVAAPEWDGVDAACYYGEDFDAAEAVDLIQLKYSGASPSANWTVARLVHADNKSKSNALIYRLASAWKAMCLRRPELVASKKISVKLVSNQPVSDRVTKALRAPAGDAERKMLRSASRLSARDFTTFAAALDFSGCGDASRFAQEERVIEALSALRDGDVRTDLFRLREFIRERMRPEGQGKEIVAASIFGLFGHADPHAFYPCPSRIKQVQRVVPRAASLSLSELFEGGTPKICLHGAGGEGKTTVLQDLSSRLPNGSELVVYDCYGEGTYLDANSYRHRAADALLQLANECSAKLLLPPVFAEPGIDHPRRFAAKLAAAASALSARSPGALLVIAVDAADNAVTAAGRCIPPETAFVHDFARLGGLPPNVRLLVSARTGRLDALALPDDVVRVPLTCFTAPESRQFVEDRLGPQDDAWHADFYRLSGGNPRVQNYAIEFGDGDADRALDYLNPNGKDLGGIFAARMAEAAAKTGQADDLSRLSAAMATLPRPVPLAHLAAIAGHSDDHCRDIVLDLAPGLTLRAGTVGFADEDFEDFVRGKGAAAVSDTIKRAADRLYELHEGDGYASAHVSALALLAGRRSVVLDLVRENPLDYPIEDPGLRGEVHRRRLRAAMHVCRDTGNVVDAASLLLEGAHAIRTDEAVERTLVNQVELAAHFSRDRIVSLVLRDRTQRQMHGELLMHLASIDGIAGDRIGARANERAFYAWEEYRASEREKLGGGEDELWDDDPRWRLDADDVAALVIGRLNVAGAEEAVGIWSRARPASFRLEIARHIVERLARMGRTALLRDFDIALPSHHLARPLIAFARALNGEPIDIALLQRQVERLVRHWGFEASEASTDYMPDSEDVQRIAWLLDTCDLIAARGGDRARLADLLDRAAPSKVRTVAALTDYAPRASDLAVRAFALAAVLSGQTPSFQDFLVEVAPTADKPLNHAGEQERQRAREKAKLLFEPLLELHRTRAEILTGVVQPSDAPAELAKVVKRLVGRRGYPLRDDEARRRDDRAAGAMVMLAIVPGVDPSALFSVIADLLGPVPGLMRFGIFDLLGRAAWIGALHPSIVALAVAMSDDTRAMRMPADEKIEQIAGIALLLLLVDRDAAQYCYQAALSAAGEVDMDIVHALSISAPLAARARSGLQPADGAALATSLASVAQDAATRLGTSDGFPWAEVGGALSTLSPSVALAAAARFRELELVGAGFLATVLGALAEAGPFDDAVLAAFLPLLGQHADDLVLTLLARGDEQVREVAAEVLLRENATPPGRSDPGEKPATGLWTTALAASRRFIADRKPDEEHGDQSWRHQAPREAKPRPVLDPALLSPKGIDGVTSFLARVDTIIKTEGERYPSRRGVAERLLERVPDHRVAAFLDIVCDIPSEDEIVTDISHLLNQLLNRWHDRPGATEWARQRLLRVIEARLPDFSYDVLYRRSSLDALLARTGATEADIGARLLVAIERHIEELQGTTVFRLVGQLARFVTPEDARNILDRHLDAMLGRVASEDRVIPGFDTVPVEPDAAVGRFFYAELGNIDQRCRWRAAHGLRLLARLGRADVLEEVRASYERMTEPAFGHPVAPFYFLAARLWFMLGCARIAWEMPAAVAPMGDWLLNQGDRPDFPHLLVREAARQALEGLLRVDPNAFDAEAQARIAGINRPGVPPQMSAQPNWHKGYDRHQFVAGTRRFRFDSMDTLPYWYTPILRCFSDPDDAGFLDRAEHWIVDTWGASDEIWEYDKLRGNARFNRGGLDGNRHGSLPTVERYRTYLEWHAMYVAGGEILATWPLNLPGHEDSWDGFDDWLRRQGITMAPIWLADLRGPKPLEEDMWWKPEREGWTAEPTAPMFQHLLGLDDPDWIVISSRRTVLRSGLYGSTRIESSLVSRENATALRLALEASENSFQYRLAVNGDEQHEIAQGRFVLRSLLSDSTGDTDLDEHDPWRASVRAPGQVPHPDIVTALGLTRDKEGFPEWHDAAGKVVIRSRAWSDPMPLDRNSREREADGRELLIRRDKLHQLLNRLGLDLIVNLTVQRRVGERRHSNGESKEEPEFDYVILFRFDGGIETRAGDLGSWA